MQKETTREVSILGWFAAGFVLVLGIKLILAASLDLYSDEIFYWWASTRLALAYSDLPFMTALLAGLGSGFEPATPLQVRSLFLLLGSILPFLVYWVARPVSGHRMALESAALTLCLPLGGFLGLLAVPDVPLICFGLLAIGSFERALRTNSWLFWIATGLWVALGLSTHYRFLLYPLAAMLLLALYKPERKQWRNNRFWTAVVVASLGLIPIIWFNLNHQLSSASFYLVERHPWEFQPMGLLHLFKQAGLVTPPLYLLFLYTLWHLFRQSREGKRSSALLLAFSLTNLAVYLVLAPWTDANSTSIHWPLSGYFPLLIAVPSALRILYENLREKRSSTFAHRALVAVPVVGYAGTLVALLGVGSQAFNPQLQPLLGTGVLSTKMAGWDEYAEHTENILGEHFTDANPLIITDNYYTAAQSEFAGLTSSALTIDQDKAVRDGRITQLNLWAVDTTSLKHYVGASALYVNEDSTLEIEDKDALMGLLCRRSASVRKLDDLILFNGDKAYSYYLAAGIKAENSTTAAFPCPYPMHAWIDNPQSGESLSGTVNVTGWAYSEDIGIAEVSLFLNGESVVTARYGLPRPDVVEVRNIRTDPNAPNLGFELRLDTTEVENGKYELAIQLRNRLGHSRRYGERTVLVDN